MAELLGRIITPAVDRRDQERVAHPQGRQEACQESPSRLRPAGRAGPPAGRTMPALTLLIVLF
jgi:hypothetical protein